VTGLIRTVALLTAQTLFNCVFIILFSEHIRKINLGKAKMLADSLKMGYFYDIGYVICVRWILPNGQVKLVVGEGNHRVSALKMLGEKSIDMLVFTAPKGIICAFDFLFGFLANSFFAGYQVQDKDILIIASMSNVLKNVQYKNTLANNMHTFVTAWHASGHTSRGDAMNSQAMHELTVCCSFYLLITNSLYRITFGKVLAQQEMIGI